MGGTAAAKTGQYPKRQNKALQENAALFYFLQSNGIQSMQQLHEKIVDMNARYYDLRGKIVSAERREMRAAGQQAQGHPQAA